jgi:2-phospho-L-lactate/phosphoenolpyruvate guanylyltransferase
MREPDWAVVVPVKRLAAAKTRLRNTTTTSAVPHDQLVLAFAQDTVRAALACPLVSEALVVTDDPVATAALERLGARVVPDKPDAGLNAAVAYGAATLARPARWVAALTADLPALRPAELAAALRAAATAPRRGFVPDAAGTGTTLLVAPPLVALDPRFGPGSAASHLASGARRLDGPWPSLRRDVDTRDDLAEAARLGLGPATGTLGPHTGVTVHGMQGTVSEFDPATRGGALLLDDGTRLTFAAGAFDASGLRLLRLGQRVQVEQDPDGTVTRVTIPTIRG